MRMGLLPLFRLASVIAYRRIASNWKLELAVALGILLAVAMVAGGVIYSAVLEEAALQRTLTDSTDEEVNLKVRYFYNMNSVFHQNAENLIVERVQPSLEEYYSDQAQWLRTSTFYFEGYSHLELAQQIRPRGRLQYITGFEGPHIGDRGPAALELRGAGGVCRGRLRPGPAGSFSGRRGRSRASRSGRRATASKGQAGRYCPDHGPERALLGTASPTASATLAPTGTGYRCSPNPPAFYKPWRTGIRACIPRRAGSSTWTGLTFGRLRSGSFRTRWSG